MRFLAKTFLVFAFLSCAPAFAQEEPPARVGRVSLVSGTLAFYGPGDADWSAAKVNLPVGAGAWLMTDPQSRAAVRVGADSIDLSNDTQLNFAALRDRVMQIALAQGRIDLHLRRLKQDDTAEIDVPRGGVWLLQPGVYDIDSGGQDQPTRITVFVGSARFAGGGIDTLVNAGDLLVLSGSDTLSTAVKRAAPDVNITKINTIIAAQPGAADPPPQVVSQQFANRTAATVVPARVPAESSQVAPAAVAVPPQVLHQAAVSITPPVLPRPAISVPLQC